MVKKQPLFKANIDGLDDKARWYTIVTKYNYEQKVASDINKIAVNNKDIVEAFSGIQEVKYKVINKHNEEKIKTKNNKVMANYVFAKVVMNATIWSILMNITGVSSILCISGTPVFTEESKIKDIRDMLKPIMEE